MEASGLFSLPVFLSGLFRGVYICTANLTDFVTFFGQIFSEVALKGQRVGFTGIEAADSANFQVIRH